MACYDDRYILKLASENDGIVVSNDNYRDLVNENPEYKKVVEERLLMYSFVNDRFMPPDDPLGRHGPSLENFLRRKHKPPEILPPACPYGKKCTYGNKCKYYHPERGNQPQKSVSERLAEQAKIQLQEVKARAAGKSRESSPGEKIKASHTGSLPPNFNNMSENKVKKTALHRTKSVIPSSTSDISWSQKTNKQMKAHKPNNPELYLSLSTPLSVPGDHLSVTKRFSDPDNVTSNRTVSSITSSSRAYHSSDNSPVDNLHRKLQRQLTINPSCDPRLLHLPGYKERLHQSAEEHQHNIPQPIGTRRPLNRLGSDGSTHVIAHHQQQQHHQVHQLLPSYLTAPSQHANVTRIASAPDSHTNWPPSNQSQMARINSTSDSRLNMSPIPQSHFHSLIQTSNSPVAPFPTQTIWSSSNALPGLLVAPSPSTWSHQPHDISAPTISGSTVRPSSVPPHTLSQQQPTSLVNPTPMKPSVNYVTSEPRDRLYFHLSSIFPENQVKAAMELYPDEINAQRICAAILDMFPKG